MLPGRVCLAFEHETMPTVVEVNQCKTPCGPNNCCSEEHGEVGIFILKKLLIV
jgi:hypothetical protein